MGHPFVDYGCTSYGGKLIQSIGLFGCENHLSGASHSSDASDHSTSSQAGGQPSSTSSPGHSDGSGGGGGGLTESNKIALGVGLGVGLPSAIVAIATMVKYIRGRIQKRRTDTPLESNMYVLNQWNRGN